MTEPSNRRLRNAALISVCLAGSFALGALAILYLRPMPMERVEEQPSGPLEFSSLPGWAQDDHAAALTVFRRSCIFLDDRPSGDKMGVTGTVADWRLVCRAAHDLPDPIGNDAARAFFEKNFRPVAVVGDDGDEGLFTGYYEPELLGSLKPGPEYQVPLYRRPPDLVTFDQGIPRHSSSAGLKRGRIVDGRAHGYYTREEISKGALDGKVEPLLYLKDKVDAFFLHIQGSGRVRLANGDVRRVAFAAKTGRPYTPIGRILVERNEIPREKVSMQSIKAWLRANPDKADEVMWQNQSYIFFREVDDVDPNLGPPGAQGIPLTPGRSLAVDKRFHGYGSLLWLDSTAPAEDGKTEDTLRRLMIAQDTGSAILGPVRGDVFWGSGEKAGEIAGRMKSTGRLFVLVPHVVAASAGPTEPSL